MRRKGSQWCDRVHDGASSSASIVAQLPCASTSHPHCELADGGMSLPMKGMATCERVPRRSPAGVLSVAIVGRELSPGTCSIEWFSHRPSRQDPTATDVKRRSPGSGRLCWGGLPSQEGAGSRDVGWFAMAGWSMGRAAGSVGDWLVVMCPGSAGLDCGGKGKIPVVALVGWAVAAHSRAWLGCGGKREMPEEGTVLRMVRPTPMGFSPVF
ncbi:hypothetical protein TIFTF001_040212 [Ficus carica]|uniref:Uncharacterized protein n=1 Tax=Ficus carica TaxID=3494 RepID=A0AA88CIM1_FICCA|nr:hypothetical protein TIFTF001_040212 [Ficus carica]